MGVVTPSGRARRRREQREKLAERVARLREGGGLEEVPAEEEVPEEEAPE